MKKFLLAIAILLTGICLHAQNKECNRLLLHQKDQDAIIYNMNYIDSLSFTKTGSVDNLILHNSNGLKDEYVIDNLDSLIFRNVQGKVAANINIIDYSTTHVKFDITRTASCVGFKLMCMDYYSASAFPSDYLIQYIDENAAETYYQDFENVEFNDLELDHDTEYAIVSVGIDEYGLLCDVVKAKFITRAENLVGDPNVTVEVVDNNFYDFTLEFTPNTDVSKYYTLVAQEGSIETQYKMFAASFGWENMSDMIVEWGYEFSKKSNQQYDEEEPNTYYEVYVQALDVNGVRAPYKVFKFKTRSLGGDGIANVDIKLGDYVLTEWYNENNELEMLPSQFLTFTPNNQASAYRFDVMLESTYKNDIDDIQEELCSDPFMQTPGWFFYEALTTDFQINHGLKCVAIAAAKNANGEWGPITELYFTTPEETPGNDPNDKLELSVDKTSILANGKDMANFTVKLNGTELESGYLLSVIELEGFLTDNKFYTTEAGTYTIVAKYNGIESNEIKIEAVEESGIELRVDKTKIKNNGVDKATFTVLFNGIDVTAESIIFNVTDNKNLDGNTFSSENVGSYVFNATYNEATSSNITVTVEKARVYAPGDLYNENGVKGVVFHVSDGGTSGYIMSMDEAYLQWSTENVWANCLSGNGAWNTEDMLKLGADKYPAAKWCAEHGNGWYMPSSYELNLMWTAVSNGTHVFDNEYVKLYNDKLDDPIQQDYYWSSSETSEDMAEVVVFIDKSVVCLNPLKSSYFLVRAIRKF